MGMEVAGSEVPIANGEAIAMVHDKENGKVDSSEPIKFGSQATEEPEANGDAKHVANSNLPKDAVDEWPAEPQIHTFWFVKYRMFEDPTLKAKIDKTDREILKFNQRRSQIIEELKPKRASRSELITELKSLNAENSQYWEVINEKREEMKPLQDALGTLRGSARERGGICSTEEELNSLIRSMEYQMQHESLTLKEEKQLVREIKELEATRPKVIANGARMAKIRESLGQTEVIQDQVKLLGTDLEGVRKQKAEVNARRDHLSRQVKAIDDQIKPLQDEYTALGQKRDDAVEAIRQLRKERDEMNAYFFENRNVITSAKSVAARKDVKALNELVHSEVEKFMVHWNTGKAFRDDYQKRLLTSLDMRQLSKDGRMRNPDEKPLVTVEVAPRAVIEVPSKTVPKPQKEDPKKNTKEESLPTQKAQKESKKNPKEFKAISERAIEEEDDFVIEKPNKDVTKESNLEEIALKQKRREEEMEKQRDALERKKKKQEKADAKAALRAQKEAEKKQKKEREKKLKKKEASSAPEEEQKENESEEAETEKAEDEKETLEDSTSSKPKKQNDKNALKFRKPIKTRLAQPKAILKKKKSQNYWIWGSAVVASILLVVLLAFAYTRAV